MVNGEVADVSDLRAGTLERWGSLLIVVAVCRDSNASYGGGSGLGGQPDNNVLPVVAMAETGGGRVLWHVPAVHDAEFAIVSTCASVDLASGGRASAV